MAIQWVFNPFTGKLDATSVEDLSGYIPYIGATADVDLGVHNLTTTGTLGAGASTLISVKTATIFPPADSTTAVQINKADGTTNVLNVDTTNSRVGIGTTGPNEKLTISGGNIALTTANSKITGSTGLTLEETGDTYGTVRLNLQNRYGVNGAMFEQAGSADLVDFVFKGLNNQRNIRYENRGGMSYTVGTPQFEIGVAGDPTLVVADTNSAFLKGNVGIGTTAPTAKLMVAGTSTFGIKNDQAASGELLAGNWLETRANSANTVIFGNADGTNAKGLVLAYYNGGNWYSGVELLNVASGFGNLVLMKSAGNVGIGTTGPTAVLHLKAGTATASTAPLKFTSGTLNTTAEAGAVEFLTDAYYGTTTTNAVRRMIVMGKTGRATAQTAANASVATYTLGATDASYEVSANVLVTTSSAEAFTVTCAYTDEGNTARTLTFNFQLLAGTIGTAINFANGAVPYEGIPIHIRCKASTAITIATTGTFTGATYSAEGVIKQIA